MTFSMWVSRGEAVPTGDAQRDAERHVSKLTLVGDIGRHGEVALLDVLTEVLDILGSSCIRMSKRLKSGLIGESRVRRMAPCRPIWRNSAARKSFKIDAAHGIFCYEEMERLPSLPLAKDPPVAKPMVRPPDTPAP